MKFILLLITLFTFSAYGVDGYQDIKFGISYKDLVSKKKCSLIKDLASSQTNIDVYVCEDFKMTPQKTVAASFYFVEGKLLRVGLMVGDSSEDFIAYAQALNSKYGQASRRPASQEIGLYDQRKSNTLDIAWDNNTVILRQFREGEEEGTLVVYSSPLYESALFKAKTKGLESAL